MDDRKIFILKLDWNNNEDIIESLLSLERGKNKYIISKVPPYIFFQLEKVFQIMETLGSARIEGNNTTIAEYIEFIKPQTRKKESIIEIDNIKKAINFIEENTDKNTYISKMYISELHKIITNNLTPAPNGEGSRFPGKLRKIDIKIAGAKHKPPKGIILQDYFNEFIKFINKKYKRKDILLMIAIAHHRFSYIHPFDNGNGRVNRLLTYALLLKYGYILKRSNILNPSAIFYSNRSKYYKMLSIADSLKKKDILNWVEYFLLGLDNRIKKIESLLNIKYVRNNLILPTIKKVYEREKINKKEFEVLKYIANKEDFSIKSKELNKVGINHSVNKSRMINRLKDKFLILSIKENGRIYSISFRGLLKEIFFILDKEGFVDKFLQ